jgi:hypothetical protein
MSKMNYALVSVPDELCFAIRAMRFSFLPIEGHLANP